MNNESLETKLSNLKEQVSLSISEKEIHRDALSSFMHKPVASPAVSAASPFQRFFAPLQYAVVGLSVLVMTGAGIAFSAEHALPSEILYGVKLNVTEPLRIFLASDSVERAEIESLYAERRLEEFSIASIQKKLDPETVAAITTSFDEHVSGVQDAIAELRVEGAHDEALSANTDLRSKLRAHKVIIEKIDRTEPVDISALMAIVNTELNEAEVSATDIITSVVGAVDDPLSAKSLDEYLDESEQIISDIRSDIESDNTTLDTGDHRIIEDRIDIAEDALAQAGERRYGESAEDALMLYTEARNVLTELKTLVDADQTLGIDVIDE